MTSAVPPPARRADPDRTWPQWGVSLLLVLAVHGSVLLRLHRTLPAPGQPVPEAILMDLAPEPSAPTVVANSAPVLPPSPVLPPTPQPPIDQPAPDQPSFDQPPPDRPPPDQPTPPDPPPEAPSLDVPMPAPSAIPDVVPPVPPAKPPQPHASRTPSPRPAVAKPAPQAAASPPAAAAAAPDRAPPGPAASPPSGQAVASWQSELLARLARFRRFPPDAQRRGEQGVVLMRVTMAKSGQVLSMAMAHGSGYADLDAEAQAWITRAEPLPAFPAEITVQTMELMIPLRFTLR